MPYTADPAGTPRDEVRLIIGDTNPLAEQLLDQEIDYFLDRNGGNVDLAAIEAAEALMAKYTCLADETTGDISVKWSQKALGYKRLIDSLKDKASRKTAPRIFAGGISIEQVRQSNKDEDRVPDRFSVGMNDNGRVTNCDNSLGCDES